MVNPKAFVFHGTRAYGVHVAVARTYEHACQLIGQRPDDGVVGYNQWVTQRKQGKQLRFYAEVIEEGEAKDFGE